LIIGSTVVAVGLLAIAGSVIYATRKICSALVRYPEVHAPSVFSDRKEVVPSETRCTQPEGAIPVVVPAIDFGDSNIETNLKVKGRVIAGGEDLSKAVAALKKTGEG